MLGGISKLGGVSSEQLLTKLVGIENGLLRSAAALGIKGLSEVSENELQLVLEPLYRSIVFGEDYDAPTVEEMVYTAVISFVMTGVVEGDEIAAYARKKPAKAADFEFSPEPAWFDNADATVDPDGNVGYDGNSFNEETFSVRTIEGYDHTIRNMVNIDTPTLLDAAKDGIRHGGVYRDAIGKKRNTLEKSISSHTNQVIEHSKKINNPGKYDLGWNEKDIRQQEGLLRKWQKDLKRNAEQAEIEIAVWKELYENEY